MPLVAPTVAHARVAKRAIRPPRRFRIKIWQGNSANVVYDNERGSPDGSDPVTNLGGGSIVVHKK